MPIMARPGGWAPETPPEIIEGCAIPPGAIPLWNSFMKLSTRRNFSMFGAPMPVLYRDILDEVQRCPWEDKAEAENVLAALDHEFLVMAAEEMDRKSKSSG